MELEYCHYYMVISDVILSMFLIIICGFTYSYYSLVSMSVIVFNDHKTCHLLPDLSSCFTLLALMTPALGPPVGPPPGAPPLIPALVTLLVLFLVDDIMAEILVRAKTMNVINISWYTKFMLTWLFNYQSQLFSSTPYTPYYCAVFHIIMFYEYLDLINIFSCIHYPDWSCPITSHTYALRPQLTPHLTSHASHTCTRLGASHVSLISKITHN